MAELKNQVLEDDQFLEDTQEVVDVDLENDFFEETKGFFENELEEGNPRADLYIPKVEQFENNHDKIIEEGKYVENNNGEKIASPMEMSTDQIIEKCENDKELNNTQAQALLDFPPQISDMSHEEKYKCLSNTVESANDYSKTVDEKIQEIKEKPERAVAIGETIMENSNRINKGYVDIRKSTTKEELIESTDKLTQIFEYGKSVLARRTREANKRDEIFTNAIKENEDLIKNHQKNIDKIYPEQQEAIQKESAEMEKEKNILQALVMAAKTEKERADYEEKLKICEEYLNVVYPTMIKNIEKNIEIEKQQIETINEQMEILKEARHKVRQDRWRPAALITAGYDKLIELIPNIINKFKDYNREFQNYKTESLEKYKNNYQEFVNAVKENNENIKNNIKEEINMAERKTVGKIKTLKNWMGNKFLDVVKGVSKKINTWIDKKELEQKSQCGKMLDLLNNFSEEKQKFLEENFEKPWRMKHGTPLSVWSKEKSTAAIKFLERTKKKEKSSTAER